MTKDQAQNPRAFTDRVKEGIFNRLKMIQGAYDETDKFSILCFARFPV